MTNVEALKTIVILDRKDFNSKAASKQLSKQLINALHTLGINLNDTREFCEWLEYPVEV